MTESQLQKVKNDKSQLAKSQNDIIIQNVGKS